MLQKINFIYKNNYLLDAVVVVDDDALVVFLGVLWCGSKAKIIVWSSIWTSQARLLSSLAASVFKYIAS